MPGPFLLNLHFEPNHVNFCEVAQDVILYNADCDLRKMYSMVPILIICKLLWWPSIIRRIKSKLLTKTLWCMIGLQTSESLGSNHIGLLTEPALSCLRAFVPLLLSVYLALSWALSVTLYFILQPQPKCHCLSDVFSPCSIHSQHSFTPTSTLLSSWHLF